MQGNFKNIRLSENVLNHIINTAIKIFGENIKIWIFGSRVDLNKKGGDIDIYIEVKECKDIFSKS